MFCSNLGTYSNMNISRYIYCRMHDWNHFLVILWNSFYDFHSKFCSKLYLHKKPSIKIISFGTLYQSPTWDRRERCRTLKDSMVTSSAESALSSIQTPAAIQSGQHSTVRSLQRPLSATGVLKIIKWWSLHTLCALQQHLKIVLSCCSLACCHTTYTQKRPKH